MNTPFEVARLWIAPPESGIANVARHLGPDLQRLALRLCRCPHEAHDLVQDTLERAMRSWHRLAPHSDVRAWLSVILRNRFFDSRKRHRLELVGPAANQAISRAEASETAPAAEPAWTLVASEDLERAVAQLEAPFRTVYLMSTREGLPYAEIGRQLGIPSATVGSRLSRARRKLRVILQRERAASRRASAR